MKIYSVIKYSKNNFDQWNEFVSKSKNGTFIHNRNFMEYHSNRFQDYSLIVIENQKWVAILPANIVENTLNSHQGLSFKNSKTVLKTTIADSNFNFSL